MTIQEKIDAFENKLIELKIKIHFKYLRTNKKEYINITKEQYVDRIINILKYLQK